MRRSSAVIAVAAIHVKAMLDAKNQVQSYVDISVCAEAAGGTRSMMPSPV